MGMMDEIKQAYESGKLEFIKNDLANFIKIHKEEIKGIKNKPLSEKNMATFQIRMR